MTYKEIFDLKYKQGVSTYELVQLYPDYIDRVSEIALLEIPEETLSQILEGKRMLKRLRALKKRLMG